MTVCTSCTLQSCTASHTGKMSSNRKLHTGVIYHPVLGYPIPPPVPVAVARRNARERSRVKTVNESYQHLKNHVPGAARQKRMSKVDIIKHSIDYIQKLQKMVNINNSERSSFHFSSYQHQQMNNITNENAQATFLTHFPFQQDQHQHHHLQQQHQQQHQDLQSTNQNQAQDLPQLPQLPVSPSSDSTCSSSTSISSYLSSMSASYPSELYNTNNLVDDQLLEDNILDVIAEWQDS